ncbi:hypothetical protein GALL_259480 [mine drainage metagenome]|uniref:Uncharacterized protein n=1 Tax=mine drainage metagenome TaxID=410659 RepID=A0A1J5RJE8_9ZZZZ
MANATASAVERDLQSIPFHAHVVHVWRQPEPTKHAFAWRVVRDVDQQEIAAGAADTTSQAWEQALAAAGHESPSQGLEFTGTRASAREDCAWDWETKSMCRDDYPKCPSDVFSRLERITRAAMGADAIADLLFQNNIEVDKGVAEDGSPLRMRTVEGLTRALGCLAEYVMEEAHRCALEVSHE